MKFAPFTRLVDAIRKTPAPGWAPHWKRHGDDYGLYSDDKHRSRVMFMRICVWGEIAVKFEDGRETCIWPTGETVRPYSVGLTRHRYPVADQ